MAKTYLDILSERGVRPFLTDVAFEELQKFDYKSHLDWKKAAEDFGIQELLKKYRRFRRKPKLTEREKLVITAYTGYVLEGTAGKVVDFVEQELGHSIQTPEPPAVPVVVEVRRALQEEFCEICRKHHIFDYI